MQNKYRLLACAAGMAVMLAGCSFFHTDSTEPSIQQAPTEIVQEGPENPAGEAVQDIPGNRAEKITDETPENPAEEAEQKTPENPAGEIAQKTPENPAEKIMQETPNNHAEETEQEAIVQSFLDKMSLEDKVAQLFIIYPEMLVPEVDRVTAAGKMSREAFDRRPVGGLIYMRQNLESKEQVQTMFSNFQEISLARTGLVALLCVDEEGGTVTSVGGTESLGIPRIEHMAEIGEKNQPDEAFRMGEFVGGYLAELGFNVDFAPVADVLSNPENNVVKKRSFGADPALVTAMAAAFSDGLQSKGILSAYKHFPGHGATAGDTHKGYSYTEKTLEELKACELIPFADGVQREVPLIMIGHISLPEVVGDDTPASLSPYIVNTLLREEMGYDGIIVTDALAMGAIVREYSSDDAAVKALEAGADILLLPENFELAYQGVLNAVHEGRVSEQRIDESLRRIIRQKLRLKENMQTAGRQNQDTESEGEETAEKFIQEEERKQ